MTYKLGEIEWKRVGGNGDSIRFYDSESALIRHLRTLGFEPVIQWSKKTACICRRCPRKGTVLGNFLDTQENRV